MLHTLQGSELKRLIEEGGYKQKAVAARAGLREQHLSKILDKTDISVTELEKIARAINLKPGDLLENSCGQTRKILPLVGVLRDFDDAAIPQVMSVLEALRTLHAGTKDSDGINDAGPSNLVSSRASATSDNEDEPGGFAPEPPQGSDEQATGSRGGRHGSTARSKAKGKQG